MKNKHPRLYKALVFTGQVLLFYAFFMYFIFGNFVNIPQFIYANF